MSGGFRGPIDEMFRPLLEATTKMTVASGIASIWHTPAEEASATFSEFEDRYPGRFLLGLGASHQVFVEGSGQAYLHPYRHMAEYLDALDTKAPAVPRQRRILAALGPRMLELARARTAGAHSYFVPVEHTAMARSILGAQALLAPEQAVVVETDPEIARGVAREHLAVYLALPNYTNNLRRLGFSEADIEPPGTDSTVDRLVAWGDAATIASRVGSHFDAGADHVCLQVLTADSKRFARTEYAALAAALIRQ